MFFFSYLIISFLFYRNLFLLQLTWWMPIQNLGGTLFIPHAQSWLLRFVFQFHPVSFIFSFSCPIFLKVFSHIFRMKQLLTMRSKRGMLSWFHVDLTLGVQGNYYVPFLFPPLIIRSCLCCDLCFLSGLRGLGNNVFTLL